MKIRDQFILTTAIFGLVLAVLAASLFFTDQRIQSISSQQQIADTIEQDARDLSFLSNDYLLYQEAQKYSLWETKYISVFNNLSTLSDSTAEQQQTVNNMNSSLQRLKSVFSELNSVVVQSQGNQVNLDFVQISWSRIEVQNQSLISDAERLSRSFRAQINSLNRNYTILVLIVAALFGAFLIVNYLFTARRVLSSISRVRSGTKIIGAGNLDYSLPDMGRNEIGDLSRAFNQMTTDLKKVSASKTDLEKEIAERKQTEQALTESEERYRALVELAPDAVLVHYEGAILYANASALKLFAAATFEQLAAHNILDYVDPENLGAARENTQFVERSDTSMVERKAYRLDGRPWMMEVAASSIIWRGRKCFQVIIRDITERKQAEAAIRDLMNSVQQEKDRLATLVSSIPDEVWFADTNKNFVLINPGALADFNLKGVKEIEVEVFARNLEVYRPDGSRRSVEESPALRALKGETVTNMEEKVRLPATGEIRDRQVSSAPVKDPEGNIVGAVSVVRDITELKKAQQAAEEYALALEEHRAHLEDIVKERTEELRTLSYRLIMIQEEERRSISRELHDQIGQSLTVLNLLLAKALRSPERPKADLDEAVQTVKEVLSQVRNLSSSLHPGMLEDLGLVPTLNWYFNDFSKKTDIDIHFQQSGLKDELPADVKITIYRIVQEALTNVVRYAEVKEANVAIVLDGQQLVIRIEDKGKGFNPESQSQGVGLRGMRERVNSFKGQLKITSAPGEGTRIEVEILLNQPDKPN